MTNKIFFVTFILVELLASCRQRNIIEKKPILNSNNLHIGDSIFENNLLSKIVFTDSSLTLDSIVYTRWTSNSKNIKTIKSFVYGKQAYENIDYYENGNIKTYQFLDFSCKNCFYKRDYDSLGNLISVNGNHIFECNIDKINLKTLTIKKGMTINIQLFYANPPDCKTFTYVKFADNEKKDVFHQSKLVSFLKTVAVDNNSYNTNKEWSEIEIGVEVKDNKTNKIDTSSKSLLYKVVN